MTTIDRIRKLAAMGLVIAAAAYFHVGLGGQLALAQTSVPGGYVGFGPNHQTEQPGGGIPTAPVVPTIGVGPVVPLPAQPHSPGTPASLPLSKAPWQLQFGAALAVDSSAYRRQRLRGGRSRVRRLRGRRSRVRRLRLPGHGRRGARRIRHVRILGRAELWPRHVAAAHAGTRPRGLSRRQSAPWFDRRDGHGSRKSGRSGRGQRRAELHRGAVRRCIRQCGERRPVTDAAGPIEASDGGPAADRTEAHVSAVPEGRSRGPRRGAGAA